MPAIEVVERIRALQFDGSTQGLKECRIFLEDVVINDAETAAVCTDLGNGTPLVEVVLPCGRKLLIPGIEIAGLFYQPGDWVILKDGAVGVCPKDDFEKCWRRVETCP